MKNLLFFKPIGRFALWGKDAAKNYFGYTDFPDGIGQFWSFSAQESASNECITQPFMQQTLKEIWDDHPDLFNSKYIHFPFIISLVGAEDHLSIQVHPNDGIAQRMGYEMGKNEAWYFLDSKPNAYIFYGHTFAHKDAFTQAIKDNNFENYLLRKPVQTGSFVYLPSGIVHAMGKGNVVYEIQQSTDVTYRLYDFNRKEKDGSLRPLHLKEGIECIDFNQKDLNNEIEPMVQSFNQSTLTYYCCEQAFIVYKFEVKDQFDYPISSYMVCTVTQGSGWVNDEMVKLGDSFLVTCANQILKLNGNMTLMCTSEV